MFTEELLRNSWLPDDHDDAMEDGWTVAFTKAKLMHITPQSAIPQVQQLAKKGYFAAAKALRICKIH